MGVGGLENIDRRGRLGRFGANPKRLAELGVMGPLKQIEWGGKMVWMGDFLPPLTFEAFLGSHDEQLKVFCLDIGERYFRVCDDRELMEAVGSELDPEGYQVSMSGLLAVAYSGGIKAAKSWLKNPGDRLGFPHTSKQFTLANGIF